MRAVNLMPPETRRSSSLSGVRAGSIGPAPVAIAVLGMVVLFVLVGVLTNNTIAQRRAQLGSLRAQVLTTTDEAQRLASYTRFVTLAQQRAETVRSIAAGRFDYQRAMEQLARVVPPDTSFQTLVATVAPGTSASASSGSAGLRAAVDAPAFEITGCTTSQDEVARLMNRLRLITGVTRVTLESTQKAASAASGGSSAGQATSGCPASYPQFALVVFFAPLPGAGTGGVVPAGSTLGGAG
jgi:Tfp pilus assembly protein PilN